MGKNLLHEEMMSLLQSDKLYDYILETSVYPREPALLTELRDITARHPRGYMGTSADAGQFISMLLKLIGAKTTLEIGVFTGYSLLLTALALPEDGKITAVDLNREYYEIGLPVIEKSRVGHKIEFIESVGLTALDGMLEREGKEGSFDFAFVDADKGNYWNYHERLMRLVKVGGVVVYDNTLWGGTVALAESEVPSVYEEGWRPILEFNRKLAADPRVQISQIPLGDGITMCKRIV